jgi:4-amino-4-deoxy-L-arabinose transferase-like glycosyltransferase
MKTRWTPWRGPETALLAATLGKALVILLCYQKAVDYGQNPPALFRGYGWDELVTSLYHGGYSMLVQIGLSDLYDMSSQSYRPPVYPLLLFAVTRCSGYCAAVVVLLHSALTSLVAYLGYLLVQAGSGRSRRAAGCLWILFLFPMNFLKSGAIDEAPLMMVFLLAALYLLGRYRRHPDRALPLVLSALVLGLSTLTRYVMLFVALGLVVYLLARPAGSRRVRHALLFGVTYAAVLFPWIARNYCVYGRPVLSVGSARLLLATQSEDFIRSFPRDHVDNIERRVLREFHRSHAYLSRLHGLALDREFRRYAAAERREFPGRFLRATLTKLKVFLPYRYYPQEGPLVKDILFVVPYGLALLAFAWTLLTCRHYGSEHVILLITLAACLAPGLIYFMLSRHLYSVIVLMTVFAFTACPGLPLGPKPQSREQGIGPAVPANP